MEECGAIASFPSSSLKQPTSVFSLALTDFRNYPSLRIEAGAGPVVLTGSNGAGKTNLLEAVSLLAPGRGLRRARMRELDRWAEAAAGPWAISARLIGPSGEVQIGTGRDVAAAERSDRRLVKLGGKPARSHTELSKYFNVLWLTPQMDSLFQEGAGVRRRFLDRLVYSFEPGHAARVNAYEQAMQERNRLLQQPGKADPDWLSALEGRMAAQGVAIAQARANTVETINDSIMMATTAFPRALLSLRGWVEEQLAGHGTALAMEAAFAEALAKFRREDAAAGRTLFGPHRADLRVHHLARDVGAEACSTGEQKALLLSILLAQARSVAAWRGSVPVLLLDEVAAHLDESRRAALFEEILSLGAQAWLTGTDAGLFVGLREEAQFFNVASGVILA